MSQGALQIRMSHSGRDHRAVRPQPPRATGRIDTRGEGDWLALRVAKVRLGATSNAEPRL